MSTTASSILKVAGIKALTTLKAIEIVDEVPSDGNSMSIKNTAEKKTKNTEEQHSRIDELGVDINALLDDLLNDPTPALSPSTPIRMHGDTSLSPLSSPTLARQIHEICKKNDQPVFSLPVVAPYHHNQLYLPNLKMRMEMIYLILLNNINNTPQHVVNNDADANNLNEPNFNQHWLNKLSQADSWESFEITLNDFTVAALEKARLHYNNNATNKRLHPQPRPNNVPLKPLT